jgi:ABC-2 type transport system ATP-binding protein
VIEVDGLTRSYGETLAVDGLSFTVEAGEVLGLVGPNGAGKTTTLRSLAGILPPTSGRIRLAGHDLAADPVAAKRHLAFIPDEPHLFEHLSAAEHLEFVARLYGVEDAEARASELMETLELTEHREKLPEQLSRGMKQKLMVACALLHRPRALILDEPLTGLDPAGMRQMKRTILAQAEGGAAVLLSSHLLQLVEELCDRILVIRAGRAVFLGGLDEIARARPDLEGLGLEEVFLALTGPQAGSAR